ncbi:MAG: type II secretion system major pseudopilin GspG [Hyphomonadaceae bacterium]|nr:type II secretion system major pseudopilin GspG [Hyphomonadaceae bacterium]
MANAQSSSPLLSDATKAGYTLTELLVVLLILGLLAAALTPITIDQMNRAKARAAKLQMEGLASALALFVADVGRAPTDQEGLNALVVQPLGAEAWAGPYVRAADRLIDPWNRRYVLTTPGANGATFSIKSLGADGIDGGKGANADLEVS